MGKIVDIVIVNWNSGKYLENCIISILKYDHHYINNIIVVDNSSSDGSMIFLNEFTKSKKIILIKNKKNNGFARACNQGAAVSFSKYLLFLNPDTYFIDNSLSKLIKYSQNKKFFDVAVFGVALMSEDREVYDSCSNFPTPRNYFFQSLGLDRVFNKYHHFVKSSTLRNFSEVNQIMGAFFLTRRSVFDVLSGFDERFFVYMEDVDFSYRAYKKNWRSLYVSNLSLVHIGGGSSRNVKSKRLFYLLSSRFLYSFKHFKLSSAVIVVIISISIEPIARLINEIRKFHFIGAIEVLCAYLFFIKWIVNHIFSWKHSK